MEVHILLVVAVVVDIQKLVLPSGGRYVVAEWVSWVLPLLLLQQLLVSLSVSLPVIDHSQKSLTLASGLCL